VKSAALYTAARVLIFLVLAGLGWLAGLRGFLLVFVALLVSMPLSYYFLARQREAFAADVERRVTDRRTRRGDLRSQLRGDDRSDEEAGGQGPHEA
jgi:Zn-dependent protease with chaperone function